MSIHAFLQRRTENILSCRRAYGLGDSFIIEKKSISLFVYPLTLVGDSNVIENSRTCLLRGVIIFYVGVRKYREETADNKKCLSMS